MSARTSEFRRGWPVLLAASAGNAGGLAAVPLYALSSFIAPLSAAFGWSRGAIGAAATVLTVGIFVTGPIVGRLCDRYGVRRLALPSMALLAAGLAAMALIRGPVLTLYAGYALLALLGAATTSVAYTRVVNGWFVHARGLALGLTMTGSGITAFVLPLVLAPVITEHGWRTGFLLLAVIALLPLPLAASLLRERRDDTTAAVPQAEASGMTAHAALRTRRFWTMIAAALVFAAAAGGAIVHLVPMLGDIGLAPGAASRTAALLGLGIVIGRLATGALLDRMNGPLLAALLMSATAGGFALLALGWTAAAPTAVLLIGLALGSEGDLLAFFTARYFGMRSYAELFGWVFGFLALGTAAGPLVIAALADDGYRTVTLIFAGQCLVAAALLGSLGRYPDWNTA